MLAMADPIDDVLVRVDGGDLGDPLPVLAYLAGQAHFKHWTTVFQEKPRGTGDALRACREQLHSDHFLVLNGDALTDLDDFPFYNAAVQRFSELHWTVYEARCSAYLLDGRHLEVVVDIGDWIEAVDRTVRSVVLERQIDLLRDVVADVHVW